MRCKNVHCALNDELLALLPALDGARQQLVLQQWAQLNIGERREVLRLLRPEQNLQTEVDFIALAKLAAYFQCGVIDMVRYIRTDEPSPEPGADT